MALKSGYRSETEQVIGEMRTVRRCPVTGGVVTRMTEAGFSRACLTALTDANQKRKSSGGGYYLRRGAWCRECRGKMRPAELEIIAIKDFKRPGKGVVMPSKRVNGTCELCGRENCKVVKNHGIICCTTCQKIQADVSLRVEQVIAEIKRQHGDKYFSGSGVDEKTADACAVLEEIKSHMGLDDKTPYSEMPDLVAGLVADVDDLIKAKHGLKALAGKMDKEILALQEQVDNFKIVDSLRADQAAAFNVASPRVGAVPINELISNAGLLAAVNTIAGVLADTRELVER